MTVPIMSIYDGRDPTGATDVAPALNRFLEELGATGQPGTLTIGA